MSAGMLIRRYVPEPVTESTVTVTIAQAAELMGLSRRQARRRLVALHAAHPSLGLLERPSYDGGRAVHRVNARSLRRILLNDDHVAVQDISQRVGLLESDRATMQARIGRVEKTLFQQDTCCKHTPANGRLRP